MAFEFKLPDIGEGVHEGEILQWLPAARAGKAQAPPAGRKLARESGVNIEALPGTGPGGRVTEADVKAAKSGAAHVAPTRIAAPEIPPAPRAGTAPLAPTVIPAGGRGGGGRKSTSP